MNVLFQRTSIRQYLNQKVEEDKIELLLKAAMQAPSAGNQQPWEFYVTDNEDFIRQLSKVSPYAKCLEKAPLAIIPCYRKKNLKYPEYAHIDMSAACENLWLEATYLGLGCVWLGIAPLQDRMDKVNELLNLSEELESFAIMAIGYPKNQTKQVDRYDVNRIHHIG